MTNKSPIPASAAAARWRRPGCLLLLTLTALLALWLGWTGWQVYGYARRLQASVSSLQALAAPNALDTIQPADLLALQPQIAALDDDIQGLARTVRPFMFITPALGWLPRVGPEATQARPLLDLATHTSAAGRLAFDSLMPVLSAWQDKQAPGSLTERIIPVLAAAAPQFEQVAARLQQAAAARSQINTTGFSTRPQGLLDRFDAALPLLQTLVRGATLAPALLGADAPRSYLLVAQNNDELRATGGFISGIGILHLDKGQISADLQDAYSVDNWAIPHPDAPAPLARFMQADVLALRDANWSPDFPTSARVIQGLYQLNKNVAADGVIAFDLNFVQALVGALEPLNMPGYQRPLTGGNVITAMRTIWAQPLDSEASVTPTSGGGSDWWKHRKDFMGDLMRATLDKAQGGDIRPGSLLFAIKEALDRRHLLISVNDPSVQALLDQSGWNGALQPGSGDFLALVDSNLGWNKVNGRVEQTLTYTVTLPANGPAQAELVVQYHHPSTTALTSCIHEARYGNTYEDMMDRCYFNYVRLLVPEGAVLRTADGLESGTLGTAPGERGTTEMHGYFVMLPGSTHTVRFVYDLPQQVFQQGGYTLRIQKQPGTRAWPLQVTVRLPADGPWQATPTDAQVQAGLVTWQTTLAQDRSLVIN
ncbi:MAG: DUF4012 domain-containing protein [Anaerolineae bacterium]